MNKMEDCWWTVVTMECASIPEVQIGLAKKIYDKLERFGKENLDKETELRRIEAEEKTQRIMDILRESKGKAHAMDLSKEPLRSLVKSLKSDLRALA